MAHKKILFVSLLFFLFLSVPAASKKNHLSYPVPVKLGIDVFLAEGLTQVKGKGVGLITNQSGVSSTLRTTRELLWENPSVQLKAIYVAEHGFYVDQAAGNQVASVKDELTGLPVYSLYGTTRRLSDDMLTGIKVLIFDMQDVGVRFYTYVSTLTYALEEAKKRNIEFIILDRPNPLGGKKLEGNIREEKFRSFLALLPIPVLHGMTVGELGNMVNNSLGIGARLKIIKMRGWKREMSFADTALQWVPTSPHIPTVESALFYPGMGLLGETGIVSVGVGSLLPFQLMGAPWIKATVFARQLERENIPGVYFRPTYFTPVYGKYKGQRCGGVQVHLTEFDQFYPVRTALHILHVFRVDYKEKFETCFTDAHKKGFDRALGTDKVRLAIEKGSTVEEIIASWQKEVDDFRSQREKFLLYP